MHIQTSFPSENICTCSYLTSPAEGLFDRRNNNLTHQIGSLLIALGSAFASVPLFQLYINPGTAKLLVSIGRKLIRSVEPTLGMYC